GVRVGEVLVRLGDRQKKVDRVGAQEKEAIQNLGIKALRTKEDELPVTSVYIRKYSTITDDVQWAHNGIIATVINGEAVPVVQNRIADAGFKDLVIIPMG
ncbi:sulfate transporter, partial [Trifolium medium]|nr:sulfate transporter [Trifolium medium]